MKNKFHCLLHQLKDNKDQNHYYVLITCSDIIFIDDMLTKGLLFAKQKALIVATPILRPVNEPGPLLIAKKIKI